MMTNANVKSRYKKLTEIPTTDSSKKIGVCLDACFLNLDQSLRDTLIRLALFRGHFTLITAKTVFPSDEVEGHVLELARRSLLEKNILGPKELCHYSLLTVQKLYCQNKALEGRAQQIYDDGRRRFIDHFLSFLEDTYKRFLCKNASKACTEFRPHMDNIMQLLDWFKSDTMDEEQRLRCIDVFNKAAKLLAKIMGGKRFNVVFNMLKDKCQQLQDKERLSDCLTSLGIKEASSSFFSPHLALEAGKRVKHDSKEADKIQSDLEINTGNSSAQCLSKYGLCVSTDGKFGEGKEMIQKAIDIRERHGEEERVMLGATFNDFAGKSGEQGHDAVDAQSELTENQRKKLSVKVTEIPYPVYGEVCTKLSIKNLTFNDFRGLAEKVGFKKHVIDAIDQRCENPTDDILKEWSKKRCKEATVGKLIELLKEIERMDAVKDLEEWVNVKSS